MPKVGLYRGQVMHCRMRPFRHRFVYRVCSILLDLDRLDHLPRLRLFSIGGRTLFSWHPCDHGARDGSPLRPWLEHLLRKAGRPAEGRTIWLFCFPRVLGHAFNPLCTYFVCDGERIETIIHEVRNTFGRHHHYVVAVDPPGTGLLRHIVDKEFYVSPFIGMAARYRFRTSLPDDRLTLAIHQTVPAGPQLLAAYVADRHPLTDAELLKSLWWAGPLGLKVVLGIYLEALRLWWKGARWRGPSTLPADRGGTAHGAPLLRPVRSARTD